jgi:uncharacterized protein YqeY
MLTKKTLEDDLKTAMKARDEVVKRTLRMVLTAVKLEEVEQQVELEEPTLLAIIQKEVKTRRESLQEAEQAGRDDLLGPTQDELEILLRYLPKPLTQDELAGIIRSVITELDVSGPGALGQVMKHVMPRVQGRAEGGAVSGLVREILSES